MLTSHGEYRRHERTDIRVPVQLVAARSASPAIMSQTLDISEGGLGVPREANQAVALGQILEVSIDGLPDRMLTARVVHIGGAHIGLKIDPGQVSSADIEKVIGSASWTQRTQVKARRHLRILGRRSGVLSINTLLRPLIRLFYRPDFVFAVYGSEKDVKTYYTPWMIRMMPSTLIGGFIRNQGHRGFMIASHHLESELARDDDKVLEYIGNLKKSFGKARTIALVGRLPNFVMRAGLPIKEPFVDGSMGTRYMIWDAARQLIEIVGYQQETRICVLGGAGRIGNLVCEDLLRIFPQVIAFDPRYEEDQLLDREKGSILRTSDPAQLARCHLYIGLTSHGDVIEELADAIPPGSMIADDTHPCISLPVRKRLAQRSIVTKKVVLSHDSFRMWPRMPAWNNRDIPGCLVEALVLLDTEREAANDFNRFMFTARKCGFRGRLVEPPED